MTMLVTLQQASDHLRIDTTDGDNDLTLKIEAASSAVLRYVGTDQPFLNSAGEVDFDSGGLPVGIPDDVKIATLILVGYFNKQRDEDPDHEYDPGYLPRPVVSLLYPFREPVIGVPTRTNTSWWP